MLNIPEIATQDEIDNFYKKISENVKRIRVEKGLSQLEVALSIGQKSAGFYATTENYTHGKRFNLIHLYKIAKLFEVDIREFFNGLDIN